MDSLGFASKENAVQEAAHLLEQLGIRSLSEPLIYALDAQTLQKEQDIYEKKIKENEWLTDMKNTGKIKLKEEWTVAGECYDIIFNVVMNGLPVTPTGYTMQQSGGVAVDGSRVEVIVSADGISYCSVYGLYEEVSKKTSPSPVLSLDEALDALSGNMSRS